MGNKKAKTKKKTELKFVFFIILISAVLFIISTYAWFSTQRNVSITNLGGLVEVAEGLEISLNAKDWYNGIVLGDGEGEFDILEDSYDGNRNLMPSELLPVSTLGLSSASASGMTDLQMLRGKLTNSKELSKIVVTKETVTNSESQEFPGFIAFDIFLKNSSKEDPNSDTDDLQLNYDSSLQIMASSLTNPDDIKTDEEKRTSTGLQNTARVAFALYGTTSTGITDVMANQETVLSTTGALNNDIAISDVAIWEPNANDHVQYIVDNNNNIKWSTTDATKYPAKFTTTTQMPTYAVSESILKVSGAEIKDIYDWSGTNSAYLQKQVVLQTVKTSTTDYSVKDGVQNLISTTDATGATNFAIPKNCICRLRIYVWLEGQDVDCINYASHGGGITLNIGLVKGSTPGTHEPLEE